MARKKFNPKVALTKGQKMAFAKLNDAMTELYNNNVMIVSNSHGSLYLINGNLVKAMANVDCSVINKERFTKISFNNCVLIPIFPNFISKEDNFLVEFQKI